MIVMLKRLILVEERLSVALLALIVVFVFAAAVLRTFGYPIIWSVDIAQLLFVWVCMLGANQALRKGEHVGVDYIVRRLPPRVQIAIDCVLAVIVVSLLALLIWFGWKLTLLNPERQLGTIDLPYALVTVAVPVGASLMLITQAGRVVYLLKVLSGRCQPDYDLPFMHKYRIGAAQL